MMSLSTMTRMSANSSSSSSHPTSAGPVLPSFAQTFSDLAGSGNNARPPPENPNSHSFHSDIDSDHDRRDQDGDRDRDRDRDRTSREQDHSHPERRSRLAPMHEQDTLLPPIFSRQDTLSSNPKKRSRDDLHRADDRESLEPQHQERVLNDGERHSPLQPSQIKREPSLSPPPPPPPGQHSSQQYNRYHHQQSHSSSSSALIYPYHSTATQSPNSSKRRKNNHEYPFSPSESHFSNERDAEHSFVGDPHSRARLHSARRGSVPGLSQSNPSSASSTSSSAHLPSQRTSPPMKRLSVMGSRANSLSPHQSASLIHPQASSHSASWSPNRPSLQPPAGNTSISKSPSQSHLRSPQQLSSQPAQQPSLVSSHSSMVLPPPSDSFSTNRKKKLGAQCQGDISVPVPRPINTGSGSATSAVTAGSGSAHTPGSSSVPGLVSATGGVNASGANTNPNIAKSNIVANSSLSTPPSPRGPPRHLTIAPHPRTRRLEPVIHSAPVNGGFFHGATRDMNATYVRGGGGGGNSGVTIRSLGISSVRLHATQAHHGGSSSDNGSSSSSSTTAGHPSITPMRIPELPPIPITPSGRTSAPVHSSSNLTASESHSVTTTTTSSSSSSSSYPYSYSRLPPPHSAGLLERFDKDTRGSCIEGHYSIVGSRLVLDRERLEKDRERLIFERDRLERERGADVPIAKNGGMRSGMVLGSINVPRTPLFSSFVHQPASSNTNSTGGARPQQGRSVPSSSSQHPVSSLSAKYLQVPLTAGLSQQPLSGNEGASSSSSSSLHTSSIQRQGGQASSLSPSNYPSGAAVVTANGSPQSDPKSSFLTLFSDFYDSLADSKLLKSWLHEQLVKSSTLVEHLEKAVNGRGNNNGAGVLSTSATATTTVTSGPDCSLPSSATTHITLTVAQLEDLIERKLSPVKNETEGLKRRVGELEEMVYEARKSGWGVDSATAANSKKRRRPDNEAGVAGNALQPPLPQPLPSSSPPVVYLRTSPPSPLTLIASSNTVIPRPLTSAPLPLLLLDGGSSRELDETEMRREVKMNGAARSPAVLIDSLSPPYPRTHSLTSPDGHVLTSASAAVSKSMVKDEERAEVPDGDVDETAAAVSLPAHQTSAVRLEC